MPNKRNIAAAASAFAVTALLSFGERAEAITANSNARIAIPVTVSESNALSFGFAFPSGVAGTIEMSLSGVQTTTGGVLALGGPHSQGIFAVTGEANNAFTTTIAATSTLSGSGADMVATLSNDAPANLTSGSATINVSGSLAVGVNQTTGIYTGTYSVTVNY